MLKYLLNRSLSNDLNADFLFVMPRHKLFDEKQLIDDTLLFNIILLYWENFGNPGKQAPPEERKG